MQKTKYIMLIMMISLFFYGCGAEVQNMNINEDVAEETDQKIEMPTGSDEQPEEVKKAEEGITLEEACKLITDMDRAMQSLTEKLDEQGENSTAEEEIRDCIGKYFDKSLTEYAMFLYRIIETDGKYVHDKHYARENFSIDTGEEIIMLSQGKDFCELGVTFTHRWEREWDKEIVPVRLEWKNGAWLITEISQWYNDFRYNYMPDEFFTPQYFTKEQAEELVEQFGTDEDGKRVQLSLNTDENGYLLAESSKELLSEKELEGLSQYELYMAVQEIYARHGKKFSDIAAAQHFSRQSWYTPYEKVFSTEVLSEIEEENIRLLSEKGKLKKEAEPDYGSLYPVSDRQGDILTGEEAVIMIMHAFDMADEAITAKDENYIEEESQDGFRYYTLGMYSDKVSLSNYLSTWFSEEAADYIIEIYKMCNGLREDETGCLELVTEGTYFGNRQEINPFEATEVLYADENECRVSVPFINYRVDWDSSAESSCGEILLRRKGDTWIIAEMSQTYYDELYKKYIDEMFLSDGTVGQLIEEKLITTNAKEYEMNIVLEKTAIKVWHRAPYAFDEIGCVDVDEPLGQYSDDKLKEYTDENFRAEIEYCCGYYGSARESHLIQVVKIYKDDQLYSMGYEIWTNYERNAVVEYGDNYYMDVDDHLARIDENENYYE